MITATLLSVSTTTVPTKLLKNHQQLKLPRVRVVNNSFVIIFIWRFTALLLLCILDWYMIWVLRVNILICVCWQHMRIIHYTHPFMQHAFIVTDICTFLGWLVDLIKPVSMFDRPSVHTYVCIYIRPTSSILRQKVSLISVKFGT